MKTLNPDGVSLSGCTYIYAPTGQAGEYAALASNPYTGCGHQCFYCYVPRLLRPILAPGGTVAEARKVFDEGATVRDGYRRGLLKDAALYQQFGITEQVMISFTSDPYHPGDTATTRWAFETMQEHGLAICALTKGGTRALRDIDLFRPERDAFAATLTSLDDRFAQKWERAAALPEDRIAALKTFHERGIFTWVSLEPTIDIDASLAIVSATHRFVDLYKVGRVNYLSITKTTDWASYALRMIERLNKFGKAFFIKKDLQPFLPQDIANPLRVPQHH